MAFSCFPDAFSFGKTLFILVGLEMLENG